MLRILDITAPDINNGNGIRITVWIAGCTHNVKDVIILGHGIIIKVKILFQNKMKY